MRAWSMGWRDRAACDGQPLDVFFWGPGAQSADHQGSAEQFCRPCPVRAECGAWIETFPRTERWGIWAGRLYRGGRSVVDLLGGGDA